MRPAHPVCMVHLQPNGGGQSKMPGSFLLPPPPPVARPVPLPMPDSKTISTPTDGGLSSPASPCKSPPHSHYSPLLPQSPHSLLTEASPKPIHGSRSWLVLCSCSKQYHIVVFIFTKDVAITEVPVFNATTVSFFPVTSKYYQLKSKNLELL